MTSAAVRKNNGAKLSLTNAFEQMSIHILQGTAASHFRMQKWKNYYKKLSYRRETARQLHTSFSAHSLIVHFTEHRTCFTTI